MALKDVVARRVLDEILGKLHREGSWKVLILDRLSTRIISACCKMSDVMAKGITLVEDLSKPRQPLPHLEAIYIVVPSEDNVKAIIDDYSTAGKSMYKSAHIFFLEKCSTTLFSRLGSSKAAKKIASLKEANMAFLPYESNVFTLDYPEAFADFYSSGSRGSHETLSERIADQVATVCAMLGEYPVVRYRSDIAPLGDIAEAIQTKLDSYKADKRDLGTGPDKSKSQLIILDRGFDVLSPVLHELTYQAMVYDLLSITNDVYTYRATTVGGDQRAKDVILDENDSIWLQLRHAHIADVSQDVSKRFQEFAVQKHLKHQGDKDVSIKDLSRYIKRVPQYQKELSGYSLHINMVDELLKRYRHGGDSSLSKVAKVEQNLAMGTDANGDPIGDPMADMMPLLFSKSLSPSNKIRLLILYILYKKGVSKEDFIKLVQHSEIPTNDRKVITNLMHMGHKILQGESVSVPKNRIKLKERLGEKYEVSRWTPLLQDIAEYAAEGRLDESYAPGIRGSVPRPSSGSSFGGSAPGGGAGAAAGATAPGTSVRQRWNWIPGTKQGDGKDGAKAPGAVAKPKGGPTIILFIVGGMTYSEMRAVYEASVATNCEVIVGSTHITTPTLFMEQLKNLKPLVTT